MKTLAFLTLVVAITSVALGSAGTAAAARTDDSDISTGGVDGLEGYLAYAALNNPELEAAFHRWQASLEKINQAGVLPDPRLTYTWYIRNVETRVGPQRHGIGLSQTLPWFGTRGLRKDAASHESEALRERYENVKRRIFFSVKRPWFEYYYLIRAREEARESLRYLKSIESTVRSRYTTGGAPYADLLRLQVEIGKLEERIASLDALVVPVVAELNAAMNRNADSAVTPPGSLPPQPVLPPDEELISRISVDNPALLEFEHLIEREGTAADLARKAFYPDITMGLTYIETGPAVMPGVGDSGKDAVLGSVMLSIPLWRDTYRAALRESELRRKALERSREAQKNSLVSTLSRALYNVRDAERKIDLYDGTLLPVAGQALEVSLKAYESGGVDFDDVLENRRTLLELELARCRAEIDRARYFAEIELLAGDLRPETEEN